MGDWNDGGLPHGSRKVQIFPPAGLDGSGSTTWGVTPKGVYALSNWNPIRRSRKTNRYDEVGKPNGSFGVDDYVEASCLAQLANVTSVMLDTGDAFTTNRAIHTTGGAAVPESWVIEEAGEPEEQNGIKFVPLRVQKLVVATGPTVYP
jgi:hypothetical protein